MELLKNVLAGVVTAAVLGLWPGTRWLAERAIEAAVKRLPEQFREEMREEWYAELDASPGGLWGIKTLCWAVDLFRGANQIAVDLGGGGTAPAVNSENRSKKGVRVKVTHVEPNLMAERLAHAFSQLSPEKQEDLSRLLSTSMAIKKLT